MRKAISLFASANVFLVCLALLSVFVAPMASMALSVAFARGVSVVLTPVIFALVLLVFWFKAGLVPAVVKPERRKRYQRGQLLLTLTNLSVISDLILTVALHDVGLSWISIAAAPLVILLWAVSLFMIWSSGA